MTPIAALPIPDSKMEAIFHKHIGNAWAFTPAQRAYAADLVATTVQAMLPKPALVMANGSPLLDYLNVPEDPPNTDEWTKGYHEARRRLYRILAPQLAAGTPGEPVQFPNRGAVEQAAAGIDQWSDGMDRVALPAGTLRHMLALIDQRAPYPAARDAVSPSAAQSEPATRWRDNTIQFARLLVEIIATQDHLDMAALAESMDLAPGEVDELFERAQQDWEQIKSATREDIA